MTLGCSCWTSGNTRLIRHELSIWPYLLYFFGIVLGRGAIVGVVAFRRVIAAPILPKTTRLRTPISIRGRLQDGPSGCTFTYAFTSGGRFSPDLGSEEIAMLSDWLERVKTDLANGSS